MPSHDPEKLERLIHQTLRSLPNRRAPHTLEARVLAALADQDDGGPADRLRP